MCLVARLATRVIERPRLIPRMIRARGGTNYPCIEVRIMHPCTTTVAPLGPGLERSHTSGVNSRSRRPSRRAKNARVPNDGRTFPSSIAEMCARVK